MASGEADLARFLSFWRSMYREAGIEKGIRWKRSTRKAELELLALRSEESVQQVFFDASAL
jgi:hypothetical protein